MIGSLVDNEPEPASTFASQLAEECGQLGTTLGVTLGVLCPVVAATNAAIFNDLLAQLLERDLVDASRVTDAHVALWSLLWGSAATPDCSPDSTPRRTTVDKILADGKVRQTTLGWLAARSELNLESGPERVFRDQAWYLIVNDDFDLDEPLVRATEPKPALARGPDRPTLVGLACASTLTELNDLVLEPLGMTYRDAQWDKGRVPRGTATINADILVVHTPVAGLTHGEVRLALERLAVARFLAGWNAEDYLRIRFQGNSSDVGFWDERAGTGLTLVDGDALYLDTFEPPWPNWLGHLEDLKAVLDNGE
jgi:hypothetical protein